MDAKFAGNWSKDNYRDPNYMLPMTGHVIMLFGCSLFWCSKLQSEMSLSTTEAKHIVTSQALRNVKPLVKLMNDVMPSPNVNYIMATIK